MEFVLIPMFIKFAIHIILLIQKQEKKQNLNLWRLFQKNIGKKLIEYLFCGAKIQLEVQKKITKKL